MAPSRASKLSFFHSFVPYLHCLDACSSAFMIVPYHDYRIPTVSRALEPLLPISSPPTATVSDFSGVVSLLTHPHLHKKVAVRPSLLPGAGNGVFATASIQRDTPIMLYPGIYYPPPPLSAVAAANGEPAINIGVSLLPDTSYLLHCGSTGGDIDASTCLDGPSHPLAIAHLVNHPPSTARPNVEKVEFIWRDLLPHSRMELQPYLQLVETINRIDNGPWYVHPITGKVEQYTPDCARLVGCVFVTTRDIKAGEELYFNYRLKINKDTPAWYHPVENLQ